MAKDLISRQTLNGFREAMVDYWVLRNIEEAFENEGVKCNLTFVPPNYISGQRRTLVEQYYSSITFHKMNDVASVLRVFERVLEDVSDPERLHRLLVKDGFSIEDGIISPPARLTPTLGWASELAGEFNLPQLQRQTKQIAEFVDSDPDLAVGRAFMLLETVCKTILSERGVGVNSKDDFGKFFRTVLSTLRLVPEEIEESAKGAKAIRRILGNLHGIARGTNEFRNLYGGHGRDGRSSSLKPRHAKLAAGAATTLAVFLYETHIETLEDSQ